MQRVSVVGASGAGKSTTGRRIAEALELPFHELDAMHWQPNWTPLEPEVMRSRVAEITSTPQWVIDGNYSLTRDLVLARADTVVWLRPPRWTSTLRAARRTSIRSLTRKRLWNDNVEGPAQVLRVWDPEHVVRWSWSSHPKLDRRYGTEMRDASKRDIEYVVLSSSRQVDRFLDGLTDGIG